MLPAGHRLRRRRDFATAVRRGRRAGRPLLVAHLYVAEGRRSARDADHAHRAAPESATPPRIGFVVSKAVGGAVVRNAVKRRLRHICRGRADRLAPGTLLVLRALPGAGSASSADLADDLDEALRRLGHGGPDGPVS